MSACPPMSAWLAHCTAAQQQAITTTGRSLLVSAAAGTGKTTVLAERCATLVCDLPPSQRCNVDELLVVTFTEAAAAEMRSRIAAAIRKRLTAAPHDGYLQRQLHLLEQAQISTIHAFCRSIVQRWFPQAKVDPQASVLSEQEADLIRNEVLEALFTELYGNIEGELAKPFVELIDEHSAGDDSTLGECILRLHQFISTLPDPQRWLESAVNQLTPDGGGEFPLEPGELLRERLERELALQIDYADHVLRTIQQCWPVASNSIDAVQELRQELIGWHNALTDADDEAVERIRQIICEHKLSKLKSRPSKCSEEDKRAYESAKALRDNTVKLLKLRIQERLCGMSLEQHRQALQRIAPQVRTVVELVRQFDRRYTAAKDEQAAVDFNDLQRHAWELLTVEGDASRASEVARQLQRQYRHVLVDEFQDVDPLQEAILRLVSREHADPPEPNLFTVGDIKQSIYRFRLAEPHLFSNRARQFRNPGENNIGELIHLQENFRSRGEIIDAVNAVFRPLMSSEFGGSDYDADAELRAGAKYPAAAAPQSTGQQEHGDSTQQFGLPAVQVHLLQKVDSRGAGTVQPQPGTDGDESEDGGTDRQAGGGTAASNGEGDSEELDGVQREAYLIASRIQKWMGGDGIQAMAVAERPATPEGPMQLRPIQYRDIVILLRARTHKAEPIAEVLRRMGIPVRIEGERSSLESTEFRDVLSLLQVLDNRYQDIPLAAVLRSWMWGRPFSETELLELRLFNREVPFCDAVEQYAVEGDNPQLRNDLAVLLAKLERYRSDIQRHPVAETLWNIYEENHLLAGAIGLPEGLRRRDNLLALHSLARNFGQFSRQGLRRFLRFIEQMLANQANPVPGKDGAAADDNVVRIMSIHTSKGLEFPVVFLADLGKRFNLARSGNMVAFDREIGLGMCAADAEKRIRYPTLIQQLIDERNRQEELSEELRVLYVALTRAREHLVLIGRCPDAMLQACAEQPPALGQRVSRLQMETACTPLDWLIPALSCTPPGTVSWGRGDGTRALFEVRTHDRAETDQWQLPAAVRQEQSRRLAGLARLEPLPTAEPAASPQQVQPLLDALLYEYPALELTTMPARVAVTELKRRWDWMHEPQYADDTTAITCSRSSQEPRASARADTPEPDVPNIDSRPPSNWPAPAFIAGQHSANAMTRGSATHRFLQLIDLTTACDGADLRGQLERMVEEGLLTAGDAKMVLLDEAGWFFTTDLGKQMRHLADSVQREVAFVTRISPERLDPMVHPQDIRDMVLIRGMVDVLVVGADGLRIIDYKTDRIDAAGCSARAKSYQMQLSLYADAIEVIHQRPVTACTLAFLHARNLVDIARQ